MPKTLLLIVLLCIVTRLPQLLSDQLLLDSDECIVGLMAKHSSEGKDVQAYFYGQSYGFTLLETTTIRIFYSLFGISDIAVKMAMLLLWILGILLFYLTLVQLNEKHSWLPLLVTLVFVFSPAWSTWAMKARGGYLTSFLLSSCFVYLVFHKQLGRRLWIQVLLGFILIAVYESKPLWLAGLIPLWVAGLIHHKKAWYGFAVIIGMLAGWEFFYPFKQQAINYWEAPKLLIPQNMFETISELPALILKSLKANYYLGQELSLNPATNVFVYGFVFLVFIVLAIGLYRMAKEKKANTLFFFSLMSVLATIFSVVFMQYPSPRYLLPLTGYLLLTMFLAVRGFEKTVILKIGTSFLIVAGIFSLFVQKDYTFGNTKRKDLIEAINYMESKDIHYAFCKNGLLQWQVVFYSNESILARYIYNTDRYPPYVKKVTEALSSDNGHTALVKFSKSFKEGTTPNARKFGKDLVVFLYPDKKRIEDEGFAL